MTGSRSADHFAEGADVKDALEVLLKYYGIPDREVPPRLKTLEEKLDYLLSAADIMYREVQLERGWHVDSMGPLITTLEESGAVITVLHNSAGVYVYRDPVSGREVRVNASEEKKIGTKAYCFYQPLPLRSLTMKDLFQYMIATLRMSDIVSFLIAVLAITLTGMVTT